ncbi:beta-ketoacyl synthase N-terminal-like domain-containing protein [Desulfatirhabdium butyrativorans]|uniref:beta-ketoacyl synthase N-terminal-like domain-containing protein n=1 Tax=Desulfatirhabdium butyrativorans TaxID=340467 RepID=UPI000404C6FA|nr:beta-ketoacyl synthase N-terminal-like domain-containing protein [Desulfatirhabdium butyrativorans]
MGCIFPGSPSPQEFWQQILDGRCASRDVPESRWGLSPDEMVAFPLKPDRAVSRMACLVEGADIDFSGFHLPGSYLESLDPLYHFVLHAGRQAAAPAHLDTLDPFRIQVILAAIALPTDTASRFSDRFPFMDTHPWAGRVTGYPAVLLARALGFSGEAFTLDAACASSLYAVYLGCQALIDHRADAILAGGVSRPDCLYTQVGFSQLRALSPSGVPAPFSASADGLVVGEGAGIVSLKRLSDALSSGDRILSVLRGIGLSNDTRGNLLAPDSEGQLRAMRAAYAAAGWQPADVDLIECHGAGTPVGDAVEIESLGRLWSGYSGNPGRCPIGSVKSTIGHLLTAAGAAALIKTVLAMASGILPPSLNTPRENEHPAITGSPFRIQREPEPWVRRDPSTPRRAAVSAFGFGGINAHVLLEEWLPPADAAEGQVYAGNPLADSAPASGMSPIAVVGMGASFSGLSNLEDLREHLFCGKPVIAERSDLRRGHSHRLEAIRGGFLDRLRFEASAFRIPPIEIDDILVQHLLMLQVGREAILDAGLKRDPEAMAAMGVVIGMDFDREACDFHKRWRSRDGSVAASIPPLTATRTIGALGGIIASRIAREFGCGGPCFTVSEDALSGFRALTVAAGLLNRREIDCMLIGAVDIFGDVRALAIAEAGRRFGAELVPFSADACGTLPGEGAGALVLKRLDDALADGDRIYAVIRGIGPCCGQADRLADTCSRSLRQSLQAAALEPDAVDLVCAHGSADPLADQAEASVFGSAFSRHPAGCGIVSAKAVIGHAGSAAAMAELVLACLCLYHRLMPKMGALPQRVMPSMKRGRLHIPNRVQYWARMAADRPRRALACAIGIDGQTGHVLLEEEPASSGGRAVLPDERVICPHWGLFVIRGDDESHLLQQIDQFQEWLVSVEGGWPIAKTACAWRVRGASASSGHKRRIAILAEDRQSLPDRCRQARDLIRSGRESRMIGPTRIAYAPKPVSGRIAFVYPGSGNHYPGMMHTLAVHFPEVFRRLEAEDGGLFDRLVPDRLVPWRLDWPQGWEQDARAALCHQPLYPIFGQVMFGCVMTRILDGLGLHPDAVIGYSLGESTGLFATGAWRDRSRMLTRMAESSLFTTDLAGPCNAVRSAWGIGAEEPFVWAAVGLRASADIVRQHLSPDMRVRLLIVNTPEECVIGGNRTDVDALVARIGCDAFEIEGVSSVHCDAVLPVRDAYRDMHRLPTTPAPGIRYFSAASGKVYQPTPDSAADAITAQALSGFDFPALIRNAWDEGVRLFVEVGPHASCSRMIDAILKDREHWCGFANWKGEDELLGVLKLCGNLAACGIDIDPAAFCGNRIHTLQAEAAETRQKQAIFRERVPGVWKIGPSDGRNRHSANLLQERGKPQGSATVADRTVERSFTTVSVNPLSRRERGGVRVEEAHRMTVQPMPKAGTPAFDRSQCMAFAVGSVADVLGPEFAVIDTYPVRVRLPDEPLMLVDRILAVEGEPRSLGKGRVVTEHDVLPGAWYLDGDRAPVCISVEAGQADLFLCSYLGIDFQVRGERMYRLLDAEVTFFRDLPRPGETIRYDIRIEKFIRQAKTWMFFFGFDGTIDGKPFIRMRNGCAGFFTAAEIEHSGGILLSDAEQAAVVGKKPQNWPPPVSDGPERYTERQIDALRVGDLAGCFGRAFDGIRISPQLRLPSGRMRLIDRVLRLDPAGGRFGLGRIVAEADIHPEDWFLTCHFMDDPVMPGTLMYECCSHSLRVLLMRAGWICDRPDARYEPFPGAKSVLKCRGPVTPKTRKVRYEVQISEIGFSPEPYVLAEADMFADGRHIVRFTGVSMRLAGASREAIETVQGRIDAASRMSGGRTAAVVRNGGGTIETGQGKSRYLKPDIEAFATGKPISALFGDGFAALDDGRFVARLPAPPFLFLDRVQTGESPGLGPRTGGVVTAEHDIDPGAWYFEAGGCGIMPYAVLQESALQTCGFLAAHCGSALSSKVGLHFRNLGGRFRLMRDVLPHPGKLAMQAGLIRVSVAGDMIIERFETRVLRDNQTVLEGETEFGFFTEAALRAQAGIRNPAIRGMSPQPVSGKQNLPFVKIADIDPVRLPAGPGLPQPMFRMIDAVCCESEDPGAYGQGVWTGMCAVRPDAWFFQAHFHGDPVWPGSLGLEAFLQVLRCGMMLKGLVPVPREPKTGARWTLLTGKEHGWTYRGQILPGNGQVRIEAHIKSMETEPIPMVIADGFLEVDGVRIYEMTDFGVGVVEENR